MRRKDLEAEIHAVDGKEGLRSDFFALGSPSVFTCPECHGMLMRMNDEAVPRFRCHTGHAYTAHSLLAGLGERVEESLWSSVRTLEESAMLLGHVAGHVPAADPTADEFRRAADAELRRAKAVRMVIAEGPNDRLSELRAAE